ncbi:MAG: 50S ribosomal protein L32 [Dehalococcoidia bacterium]
MGAQPKKKISLSRKRRRRAHLTAPVTTLVVCPQCRSPRPPHHACPTCGTYRGRNVIAVASQSQRPAGGG